MLLKKRTFGTLSILGLLLVGCETTNTSENFDTMAPNSPLKANKGMHPQIAQAFTLLKEEKYSEASSYINQVLQTQPKSVILHILNALTYEKLAETGEATGIELAVIGYQNALNLDPFNSFAMTQLGKIKYRDQQYDLAQEHFANALLIKPNDPDLIHEFAAASYYAYDIKTAVASIKRAEKLKPDDPLIQRSAAMMHAAIGDFKAAEKHFNLFQAKVGQDPQVAHVASRFSDWQSLYKSGRLTLAAAQSSSSSSDDSDTSDTSSSDSKKKKKSTNSDSGGFGTSDSGSNTSDSTGSDSSDSGTSDSGSKKSDSTASDSSDSGTSDSGSKKSKSTDSGSSDSGTSDSGSQKSKTTDAGSSPSGSSDAESEDIGLTVDTPVTEEEDVPKKEEFARGDIGRNTVSAPVTPGIEPPKDGTAPKETGPVPKSDEAPEHIIMDCYILQIDETARTSKGNNILDNLAVTLNPGALATFKASMWGSAAAPLVNNSTSSSNGDTLSFKPDSGFGVGVDSTGKLTPPGSLNATTATLQNMGSISGRVFTAGITWAGLTYSLNIANAADSRTEVVSRPTLMTYLKKESRFFSGIELVNVSSGSFGGNLSRYQVGVTLAITPETLVGDVVTLNIGVEKSILQNPNPNLLATIDVSKTRVETTARVRLGETIMLGGIYEREEVDVQQGFPGLRDLPIIQYFFSKQITSSGRRSIVILLTPRTPAAVKSAVNRAMTRESIRPHFSELVSRNPDWFNPDANAIKMFSYINQDPVLYYEFRTGDILPPSWGYDVALKDKLVELSSFLYY